MAKIYSAGVFALPPEPSTPDPHLDRVKDNGENEKTIKLFIFFQNSYTDAFMHNLHVLVSELFGTGVHNNTTPLKICFPKGFEISVLKLHRKQVKNLHCIYLKNQCQS